MFLGQALLEDRSFRVRERWYSAEKGMPMQDTRSLDGRVTLLHYVAQRLTAAEGGSAMLADELPAVAGPLVKTSLQVRDFPS